MLFGTVLDLADGILGMIMVIQTLQDYAGFQPHLHAIVADGLFRPNGTLFLPAPKGPEGVEMVFLTPGRLSPPKFRKVIRDAFPIRPGQRGQGLVADLPTKPFGKKRPPRMAVKDPGGQSLPGFERPFERGPAVGWIMIGGQPVDLLPVPAQGPLAPGDAGLDDIDVRKTLVSDALHQE